MNNYDLAKEGSETTTTIVFLRKVAGQWKWFAYIDNQLIAVSPSGYKVRWRAEDAARKVLQREHKPIFTEKLTS